MKALINYISSRVQLDAALQVQLFDYFTKEEVSKQVQLLKEHQYSKKLYFLEKGVVRSYYYHDGKEVTSWLYGEGHFFTSWHSFIGLNQSFEYIETLEDCTVYWISKERYDQLLANSPAMEQFGRKLLEEQLSFLDYFYKGFMFMTAKEKYNLLISMFPDVIQRVNLGHIASLLGISQETLSRIRRQR